MPENCKNVGVHHGPCKHSGWYTDEDVFCDLFGVKVKHSQKLDGGMGEFGSQFPDECPHSIKTEIKDERYWVKMLRVKKLRERKRIGDRRK